MCCRWAKSWSAPIPKRRSGVAQEKEERPKKKRREKANPLEVELDLGGEFPRGNMLMSSLENENEARVVSANDLNSRRV